VQEFDAFLGIHMALMSNTLPARHSICLSYSLN
jgi:hypothetical protein